MINIRKLKTCRGSICQVLEIIFKMCPRNGRFLLQRKKTNIVPIYKKDEKQTIENYCPVSLLPIYEKKFERLLHVTLEILESINFFQLIMKS